MNQNKASISIIILLTVFIVIQLGNIWELIKEF
jgi:hypothetical protein